MTPLLERKHLSLLSFCSLVLAPFLATASDWKRPAEFKVSTQIQAPNPGAWTATMGSLPGTNNIMRGGGFEQIHRRTLVVPNADADNSVELDFPTMTDWDTYAEPYMEGARVRIYRVINGEFKLVRTDTVPVGGARASGWMTQAHLQPNVTEYRHVFQGWERPEFDYFFRVQALDKEGNESGPSTILKVQRPSKVANQVTAKNATLNLTPIPQEDRAELVPPAAPSGFRIQNVDPATGLTTLAWERVEAPDLGAYRVQMSNSDPAKHRGYGLNLAGKAATEEEKIRKGDFVIVELDKPSISRHRDWSPRVWGTHLVAPPANLAFHPDEDPLKTWAFVPPPGPIPADFTDPGEKCLKISVKEGAVAEASEWKFGSRSQDYYQVLEPNKPIVLEVWLKKEKTSDTLTFTFEASDHGWQPALPITITPTTEWKKFTAVFTPTKWYESEIVGQVKWKVSGNGSLYLDNLRVYHQERPFMAPPPQELEALRVSHLHAIRTHAFVKSGSSYSMKSLLGAAGETNISHDDTLGNELKYFAKLGINPWLQVEMHMSDNEWAGLVEYLAAPYDPAKGDTPQTKPWAAMRYKQGQTKPWSEVFEKIYFEVSNETWNPPFKPWNFIGREMADASTGRVYKAGELYGLWQTHVNRAIKASPYWPALAPKWEIVLGGWHLAGGENGYAQSALKLSPEAKHVTIAPYNGGWDEGAVPVKADDTGRFLALTFTPQRGEPIYADFAADRELLRAKGFDFLPGTYEAGPGYGLPGTVNKEQIEAEAQVMKSLAGGAATLDAFLSAATHGFHLQNLFVLGRGRGFWNSHAALLNGGQPFPWWRACTELYNAHGTGDFLRVETLSVPTWDLTGTPTRPPKKEAPMVACYATRKGEVFNLFLISRKLDRFPVAGDDGFTPVTVRLPFTSASKITLRRMAGDPRATNLDADNVRIETQTIPPSLFQSPFVLNQSTGADERGLPPAGIFLYQFEGCKGIAESLPTPPVLETEPTDVLAKEGFSAEFEVGITAAHPRRFSVQWERKQGGAWQPVPGAVTPRLQFAELSAADDGAVFRCRITDPLLTQPLLSREATLRVEPFTGPVFPKAGGVPEWSKAKPVSFEFLPGEKAPKATGTFRGMWNEEFLYLLFEVNDSDVLSSAGKVWAGDGVELFLDVENSKTNKYGPGHFQIYVGFTDSNRPEFALGSNSAKLRVSKFRVNSAKTATGWKMELGIAWRELGVRKGSYLGLDAVLIDRNGSGESLKRTFADSKGQAWQNPSVFGTVKLGGGGE